MKKVKSKKQLKRILTAVLSLTMLLTVPLSASAATDAKASESSSNENEWDAYYEKENIKVRYVNADILYEYGEYYSGVYVCTHFTIEDMDSDAVKCNTDNNDSWFSFSIVATVKDKNELSGIDEGDDIVITGKVDDASDWTSTVNLSDCHVIATGSDVDTYVKDHFKSEKKQIKAAEKRKTKAAEAAAQAEANEVQDYKDSCVSIDYNDVERNPNNYDGTKTVITGTVIQASEGWFSSVTLRVNDYNGNTWYVDYNYGEGSRILENDYVTVYGECTVVETYTALFGNSVTIPSIEAKYVDIN